MTVAVVRALMESAWQGVTIAALLFVMLRVLPRERPQVRYAAALGALAAMLGGFLMAFVDGADKGKDGKADQYEFREGKLEPAPK